MLIDDLGWMNVSSDILVVCLCGDSGVLVTRKIRIMRILR